MKLVKQLLFFALAGFATFPAYSVCSVHDHACVFHGAGTIVAPYASIEDGYITATLEWNNNISGFGADLDIDGQLPDGVGPYLISSLGYPSVTDPFDSGGGDPNHARHLTTSQYRIAFQNGTAEAVHSNDAKGAAIIPGGISCMSNLYDNCEFINVKGNVPEGVYKFIGINYDYYALSDASANYRISVKNTSDSLTTYQNSHHVTQLGVDPVIGNVAQRGDETALVEFSVVNMGFKKHAQGVAIDYIGNPYSKNDTLYSAMLALGFEKDYIYVANPAKTQNDFANLQENIFGIHSNVPNTSGLTDGHTWVSVYNINAGPDSYKTYGLYGNLQPEVSRLNNSTDVFMNIEKGYSTTPEASDYWLLTREQEIKFEQYISESERWRYTNTCASWAGECVKAVIGDIINSNDTMGFETPRKTTESIWEKQNKQ